MLNLAYTPRDDLGMYLENILIGNRYDTDPTTGARIRRGSYFISNLATSWNVNRHWELFGRVENLFDRDYRAHLAGRNRVAESDVALGERLPGAGRGVFLTLKAAMR